MQISICATVAHKIDESNIIKAALQQPYIKRIHNNDKVTIAFDLQKLKNYYILKDILISYDKIYNDFISLKKSLERICGHKNLQVTENYKEIENIASEIQKTYLALHKIIINEDLSLVFRHSYLPSITTAWKLSKNGNIWIGKLTNPIFVERNISDWQLAGFNVFASKQTLANLTKVVTDAENKLTVARIFKVDENIHIEVDPSLKRFETDLTKIGSLPYNIKPNQIELLKLVKKIGHGIFSFPHFLAPYVLKIARLNGISEIQGISEIYSKFDSFSFPCELRDEDLHDVQKQAYSVWKNDECGTIVLPTGGGKCLVGIKAITEIKEPTLIIVPSLEIQDHWKKELLKWTCIPENQIGMYSSEHKEICPITIITYQSGYRILAEDEDQSSEDFVDDDFLNEFATLANRFGLLIFDEGHHSPANVFRRIMMTLKSPRRMNLTATAERHDGNERLSFLACGPIVFTADYLTLARNRIVCPIQYEKIQVPLNQTETELIYNLAKLRGDIVSEANKVNQNENELKRIETEKMALQQKLRELSKEIPYNSVDPEPSYRLAQRKVFGFAENKLLEIVKIIQRHKNSRIIIFNQLRKGTKIIQKYLSKHNVSCEILTGGILNRNLRREIFSDFSSGRIKTLVTTNVLDEGVDVPACEVAIIVNGTQRKLQMIQRVGRTARFLPTKIGYVYELVAHVDHRLYKPEYSDCKKFADVSTYELNISKARDISDLLVSDEMDKLIQNVHFLKNQKKQAAL